MPSSDRFKNTAILLAGGSGSRMNGTTEDKILAPLAGFPVIEHSIRAFIASEHIHQYVVVYRDESQRVQLEAIFEKYDVPTFWAQGGKERMHSVWAGLQSTPEDTCFVLIHDCARPCITPEAIRNSLEVAPLSGIATLARPVTDTIKIVNPLEEGFELKTPDRSKLWAMETPQTFCFGLIHAGYLKAIKGSTTLTDDLSAIENQNLSVNFVDNGRPNPKITNPADLEYIEHILSKPSPNFTHD